MAGPLPRILGFLRDNRTLNIGWGCSGDLVRGPVSGGSIRWGHRDQPAGADQGFSRKRVGAVDRLGPVGGGSGGSGRQGLVDRFHVDLSAQCGQQRKTVPFTLCKKENGAIYLSK